jgi:hypothetical protein
MIDPKILERIPCGSPDVSTKIDSLRDLVLEAFAHMGATATSSSVALTVNAFHYLITKAPDHPAVQNMTDTRDQAVLAIVLNRETRSMTAVAKEHINPATNKPFTRAAISKQVNELYDRLGVRSRSQKSEKARESYRKRAYEVHAKRRREAPKYNIAAILKGRNKCKRSNN